MKSFLALLLLGLGLVACSAEIETKEDTKTKLKTSPFSQSLSVGTEVKPAKNTVILSGFAGGDFERRFTFRSADYGYLHIDTPFIVYSKCDLSNSVEIYSFLRKKNGEELESNILTTTNRNQYVTPDYDYEIKINLYNLGSCEFMNLGFTASFTKQ